MHMAALQTLWLKLLEMFAELFLWFPAKCNWFLSLTFYACESVVLENRKWMSREVSGFTWRFATTTSLFGTRFYAWSWTQIQGITLQGINSGNGRTQTPDFDLCTSPKTPAYILHVHVAWQPFVTAATWQAVRVDNGNKLEMWRHSHWIADMAFSKWSLFEIVGNWRALSLKYSSLPKRRSTVN